MKKTILMLLLMLQSLSVTAGNEGAHGGVGVLSGDKLYVLDLFEAGLEESAYFDPSVKVDQKLKEKLEKIFTNTNEVPLDLLTKKLVEISSIDMTITYALLRTIELYNWRFVNNSLNKTHDEDPSIEIKPASRVQIAVRRSLSIFIDKSAWKKLDDKNKVALILHEIIYCFQGTIGSETSFRTREVVAYLLSPTTNVKENSAFDNFKDIIKYDFNLHKLYSTKDHLYVWDQFKNLISFPKDSEVSFSVSGKENYEARLSIAELDNEVVFEAYMKRNCELVQSQTGKEAVGISFKIEATYSFHISSGGYVSTDDRPSRSFVVYNRIIPINGKFTCDPKTLMSEKNKNDLRNFIQSLSPVSW